MQQILIVLASAVSFAVTLWVVLRVLRSIFRLHVPNPLGVILITAGIWLFFFRAITFSIPLLILGTVLLLRKNGGMANGSPRQTSKVRSRHLEMTLDHETGAIDGQILTGDRQGQVLSDLTLHELLKYYAEIQMEEESVKLLQTFLDSVHLGWRDQADESSTRSEETSPLSRQMSRDEAYKLLGLEAGCDEEDIRKAYHRLIKRVHPDSGGSAALTAQVTEARDLLLGDRQ
jgi:hypothetical protein